MNRYTYDDITVGMTESFSATVTEEMMAGFLAMTGDINPLHNDEEFAKSKGHPGKVVYGMLTSSLLSTLAGVYLPGERSLIHSVETRLMKPVYIGDTLTVTGKVVEKSESVPVMILNVNIKKQSGEMVLRGKMQIGVTD